MTILQSHITEAGVNSPTDRVPGGVSPFPLQSSGSRGSDVATLHMRHIAVEGIRCSRDNKLAPGGRTDIPGGHGGVKSVPMRKVLFFRDEIGPGRSYHYALRMMAFVVVPRLVPFVGHDVRVWTVFFAHLISNVAYLVLSLQEKVHSILPATLEAESPGQSQGNQGDARGAAEDYSLM